MAGENVYYGQGMPPAALVSLPSALVSSLLENGYVVGSKKYAGKSALIYDCTETATGRLFACKITLRKGSTSDLFNLALTEETVMRMLPAHRNVVSFKGAFVKPGYVSLIMELCEGGTLLDKMQNSNFYK